MSKFLKCPDCGREIKVQEVFSIYCLACGNNMVEIPAHSVWQFPWLYLSKSYKVKKFEFDHIYLWDGQLIKWPVVIIADQWIGNMTGCTTSVDLPNAHCYKIFRRSIWNEMVNKGYWKTVPSWTR